MTVCTLFPYDSIQYEANETRRDRSPRPASAAELTYIQQEETTYTERQRDMTGCQQTAEMQPTDVDCQHSTIVRAPGLRHKGSSKVLEVRRPHL